MLNHVLEHLFLLLLLLNEKLSSFFDEFVQRLVDFGLWVHEGYIMKKTINNKLNYHHIYSFFNI